MRLASEFQLQRWRGVSQQPQAKGETAAGLGRWRRAAAGQSPPWGPPAPESPHLALQVACYSCRSGQWSSVCPLPAGHGEPGIAVLDSRIYVLGGRSHNRGSRTGYVHIYDAGKDSWEEGPPLDNSISGLAACVLTLPRSLLLEPPRGTPDRSQADPDFASEVMSVSDWEEFDNSSED